MEKKKNPFQVSVRDIALIGMMTAVIEVSKLALAAVPNVELVTFWIIMFSLFFGPKVIYSILVFILIEVSIYGVNVGHYVFVSLAHTGTAGAALQKEGLHAGVCHFVRVLRSFVWGILFPALYCNRHRGRRHQKRSYYGVQLVGGRHSLRYPAWHFQFLCHAGAVPSRA